MKPRVQNHEDPEGEFDALLKKPKTGRDFIFPLDTAR
jgi:hypothetical protein